jgi:LmbE family N-acetylglucosaminyl deacetylase
MLSQGYRLQVTFDLIFRATCWQTRTLLYYWRMHLSFRNILAVGAHPDDIEYSCLGFLLHQKELGASVSTFVASAGSKSDPTSGENRIDESRKSLGMNGFEQHYSKNGSFDYVKTELEIRKLITEKDYDCLLVHDPRDSHQEHRIMFDVALSAIRRVDISFIKYRSVSTNHDFTANYRVGIDKFFNNKIASLGFHESQIAKKYMSLELIKKFHTFYDLCDSADNYYELFSIQSITDVSGG